MLPSTHQSFVEVLEFVWEVRKLSRRAVAVDKARPKGRKETYPINTVLITGLSDHSCSRGYLPVSPGAEISLMLRKQVPM